MVERTSLIRMLDQFPAILAEGAVIERLRRDTALALDPHLLNTGLIYNRSGRAAMGRIYAQYLQIAGDYRTPLLVAAPTWRANPERIRRAGLGDPDRINQDAVKFMRELCARHDDRNAPVLVGGLMACRGDAYQPREALPADAAEAFHRAQARSLADAGVDFIMAATLPALSEAVGLARVLSALPVPYVISFIIRKDGALLDGTPLETAIRQIDRQVDPGPCFFMLNCVHPQTVIDCLGTAMAANGVLSSRLLGIQANTSTQNPEALDGSAALDGAEPESFADDIVALHGSLGMKILGGCCGTDHRHIRAIAKRIADLYATADDAR